MIHDEAVKSALTGQIMGAELAQHLETARPANWSSLRSSAWKPGLPE